MKNLELKISGMHCTSCSAIISNRLSALHGITKAEVKYPEETASISFDEQEISEKKIKQEISNLGYSFDGAPAPNKPKTSIKEGIIYGLVPHIGCIGFIIASILGVTVAVNLFKPLLMNPWFFHILILLSIGFATASSAFYLSKNKLLSWSGIKKKKKYLATMYGSTVGINLFLFFVIFPMLANLDTGSFANPALVTLDGSVALLSQLR